MGLIISPLRACLWNIFFFINFHLEETCHINISGEKLEEININCSYSPRSTVLNIVAPNAKSLMLVGNVKNNLNLGELECLQVASILMEPIVDDFDKVFETPLSLFPSLTPLLGF